MAQVRVRNSSQFRVATSAARALATTYTFPTTSPAGFTPPKGINAARIFVEVTAVTSTPSVVFSVQVFDKLNAQWHTLISSAAVATVSRTYLEVGPALTAVTNQTASKYIGSKIRVIAVHGNTNSITYNIVGEWTA